MKNQNMVHSVGPLCNPRPRGLSLSQRHKRPGQPGRSVRHGMRPRPVTTRIVPAVASGSGDDVSRCRRLGHPGSMASASGKEEGNVAYRASGATMMAQRGWCGGVLRQRRHSSG
jgi:hypothetical protein